MKWRALIALLVGAALTGCDRTTPPPAPVPSPPPGAERVTGSERLGWNQPAGDAAELASFSYAIYVDGARSELGGVSCEATPTQAGHACAARLPGLSAGPHTLELAAFVLNAGAVVESSRSAQLQVIVGAAAAAPASLSADGAAVTTGDGVRLRLEWIATGLDHPSDLAFAEDGRIFIAERAGRVRVVRNGRPPRRRCPWHEERTGRPGSAFDFAQARKDPGAPSVGGSSGPRKRRSMSRPCGQATGCLVLHTGSRTRGISTFVAAP